ncbi:hypothetical protein B0H63DRAFT_148268 [Podospora didyma]|uniref:Uncharacterized protein n=1 Tax=Podospora didyma TaxID=330526 RepID=A0AAE0NTA1_9PEZI|nr:hypothetical protein B0H63DRAFT_148268 [Podospora didyma]
MGRTDSREGEESRYPPMTKTKKACVDGAGKMRPDVDQAASRGRRPTNGGRPVAAKQGRKSLRRSGARGSLPLGFSGPFLVVSYSLGTYLSTLASMNELTAWQCGCQVLGSIEQPMQCRRQTTGQGPRVDRNGRTNNTNSAAASQAAAAATMSRWTSEQERIVKCIQKLQAEVPTSGLAVQGKKEMHRGSAKYAGSRESWNRGDQKKDEKLDPQAARMAQPGQPPPAANLPEPSLPCLEDDDAGLNQS